MTKTEGNDVGDAGGWQSRWFRAHLRSKQATNGIYAEIVVLAVIVAIEGHAYSNAGIVAAVVGALVAVILAEIYADYIGTMIAAGRRPTPVELRTTVLNKAGAIVATAPPILLLMLGVAGVIRLDTGFAAAKWAGAGIIGLYAFVANRRAGLSSRASLLAGAVFVLIGVGLVLLKQYVH